MSNEFYDARLFGEGGGPGPRDMGCPVDRDAEDMTLVALVADPDNVNNVKVVSGGFVLFEGNSSEVLNYLSRMLQGLQV